MTTMATSRLAARVKPDTYALIKRAAEIEGITLTDFMITNLQAAARKVIADSEIIHLSLEDQHRLADALLEPHKPNENMLKAMQDYQAIFGKK
ncbi:DUF1778 domain-containing protein [Glaesserella parasuis]|uniref:type II toxin-antitoxin system TacA family antitoxin n=1 Tax=Glaesserella parasuis TaxID=738 RepID=UPI0013656EFD|nr:DUF1778 domain-containing protein [Glaesserella parasuis]MCT8829765.1 DUF1778 domain-containing protein [Glaesserella parasuis]MCT8833445.1 DUF1778 domain-containing protein [Glaesserella parasuis]MDG6354759.1 DUF1778 domain-containing protein [Glaesserella parasuis]MDO9673309.1 DUF1778 domain-containing protein [Glaesserella parasuis]MDO9852791.1 DUF1778 domain-containing protein [Glaesserella parasuis]